MDEYLYHTVDAGHIRNIGEQSVSNKIQAILELVKNAYDADSPDCTVSFHGTNDGWQPKIDTITIEDHGIGMTENDLRDKFMKVGTGTKVETSFSPKLKRRVSGEKGMGHYSAQRLGDKIVITTTPDLFDGRQFCKEDDTTYVLELDWSKYVPGKDFERIPNRIRTIARRVPGTLVKISKLRDVWTTQGKNNDLESLAKNLGSVMLPKMMRSDAKDEFDARIKVVGFKTDLPENCKGRCWIMRCTKSTQVCKERASGSSYPGAKRRTYPCNLSKTTKSLRMKLSVATCASRFIGFQVQ